MSSIDDQINRLEQRKKRARTFSEKQRIDTQINKLKAQKRSGVGVGGGRGEDPRKFGDTEKTKQRNRTVPTDSGFKILNRQPLPAGRYGEYTAKKSTPSMQKKDSDLVGSGARLKGFGYGDKSPQFHGNLDLNRAKSIRPDDNRDRLEDALLSAPEDRNIMEQFVSKLLGRDIRFTDIPDDDPDFKQGDGSIEYPAGRPDLRMGGMTARSAATTKFKKPLGMKGGGAISNAERRRIARIMQDYKQKKARKSNGKRTNR